ncbi:GtrA family protein [Prauserella flavalba]|uniref:Polysaccharide synthesis protein GtrA n=1 Tax=Prauserella flavalba TaxID=1477506 RepID=A0A318M4B1_9PSEU|nr:GtrA family protein [Prauserella flavalba]PXY37606.1 polysaccharide synthesis protein GtrA [Prauserella flavalba]
MVATDSQASEAASRPASPGLLAQLVRFALIGGFCALVDSGIYWLLLQAGTWVHLAKAISFIAGTTTAYFLNRRFTFTAAQKGGAGQIGGFMLLYTVTFFVNVGTNALALELLPEFQWRVALAWIIAQGTATTINFVMLKWVVFREPRA